MRRLPSPTPVALLVAVLLVALLPWTGATATPATAATPATPATPATDATPATPATPAATATAQDSDAPRVHLDVTGSPLINGEGGRIRAEVTLAEPADLRLRVADFDGRTVRELVEGPRDGGVITRTWNGRDADGERVPDGPYLIVATATADGTTQRAEAWVTVADRAIYPRRPDFITVAVDPGHGGSLSGAVGADGTREADLNLDIGLRLARMLDGAGVGVVITRTTDAFVNEPPEERTGDGVIDETDELAARPDAANEARADLFISIHNNTAVNEAVNGPSTFYFDERPFGTRSARLARIIQAQMQAALDGIAPDYAPYDHGALIYPYYVLRGFDPPRLRRPTQMPGVLSEGMFLSNARELRFLKRPAVRQRMADAYYDAIAAYLDRRETHVGYRLVDAPAAPVAAGERATYRVEVRNQGNEPMRGWRLTAAAFPAPSRYIGRIRTGTPAGEVRIPRLGPGRGVEVDIEVTVPEWGGAWVVLFDARDGDGRRAARLGSPQLQVPLAVFGPARPTAEEPATTD